MTVINLPPGQRHDTLIIIAKHCTIVIRANNPPSKNMCKYWTINCAFLYYTYAKQYIHYRSKVWGHFEMSLFLEDKHIFCPLK
jgi:hypothetical protein